MNRKPIKLEVRASLLLAALALVVALSGVAGAVAGSTFITSKQIRNGTVRSIDLRNGGVQSTDIKNDAVASPDLAAGAVEAEALSLPTPVQCKVDGEQRLAAPAQFAKVATVCTYSKVTVESILSVDWTGVVEGRNGGEASGCVFQLRVNGAPAAQGGGEVFGQGLAPVGATTFFTGLPAGALSVEVWARLANPSFGGGPEFNYCSIGPAAAGGVGQTVSVTEEVV